jgi:hypothetical protein
MFLRLENQFSSPTCVGLFFKFSGSDSTKICRFCTAVNFVWQTNVDCYCHNFKLQTDHEKYFQLITLVPQFGRMKYSVEITGPALSFLYYSVSSSLKVSSDWSEAMANSND